MRPYLIDFLIEAHTAFQLLPETLFLTINLLDRYCSKRIVYKKHYQLVGCSALLIAAKYGDRKDNVPTIKELNTMCCALYDDEMFTQMEWHVLATLGWAIGHPTTDAFLQMAVEHEAYDPEVEHMACYISEIALFQKEFVSKRPSDMARSSLALARYILQRAQPQQGEWAASYETQTLVTLSQQMHRPSEILIRKYSSAHHFGVATILEEFLARQASIVRGYAPPTPPSDDHGRFKISPHNPITPVKQQFLSGVNAGNLTPPITPTDHENFATNKKRCFDSYCGPPTPVSAEYHRTDFQSIGQHGPPPPCSLPSINQILPNNAMLPVNQPDAVNYTAPAKSMAEGSQITLFQSATSSHRQGPTSHCATNLPQVSFDVR